jgi:O-antigen ligase
VDSLLVAIAALVVLVWAGIVLGRGGLVGTALLVLLAGSCFGHAFFHVALGPLPLTADRLLIVVLVAQYAAYRRWGVIEPRPPAKADYVLGALVLALVVSTLLHDFRARHFQPLAFLVIFYLLPALVYWIARQADWTARTAWAVFAALAGFGVYLSATAVAETHAAWSFVFPRYIASPAFPEFLGRARGPFLNPVANGFVLTIGLCAALVLWPRAGRAGQLAIAGAVVPLFAWGLYSTLTRSVWIGAVVAVLTIVVLSLPRWWRPAVVVAAAAACALVVTFGWDHLMAFERDKGVDAELTAESAKLRPILATVAWHMFLDRPILGCGFGQYSSEVPAYLSDRSTALVLEKGRGFVQHNVFLALLSETGLVGMTLFVALLAFWTHAAWRLWRYGRPLWVRQMGLLLLGALGAYVANGMFHDVAIVAMANMFLFFLAGGAMGLYAAGLGDAPEYSAATRQRTFEPEPALV